MESISTKIAGKRLLFSMVIMLFLLLLPWGVQLYIMLSGDASLVRFGLRPWDPGGLWGIASMHFLHGGFDHLFSNTIPLFVMGSGLFFYYREISWRVLLWMMLITGVFLWFIGAAGSNHVGSSGIVYALVGFHLTGGVIRRSRRLKAFALLVVFLYGGFVWSVFPDFFPDRNISWEGHLSGLTAGIILAWYYRSQGPLPDPRPADDDCMDDDDEECEETDSDVNTGEGNTTTTSPVASPYRYHVT
jgi:membrane associated rhomboid family serine protease